MSKENAIDRLHLRQGFRGQGAERFSLANIHQSSMVGTMNEEENDTSKRIAALNDEFRRTALSGASTVPGTVFVTRGIGALAPDEQFNILAKVRDFENFTPGDDPYREHDFGVFEVEGQGKAYFKIDYYADKNMEFGADDPSDPDNSYRVMTIMLSHEY